eukprot:CAMPEP_0117775396 /NCGR_PEP_ID=MMETSP0947-20121206/27115_1 /TAXON_ID=44440 /ORGANISM="Chattonella subsalsa, Strain CCMP2191" /LENGTH=634 /DNA_ID=CAMNT_0005602099 /DNA_START=111 /DNA_END=2013 /DNA_ORIENTATION=-
MTKERKLKILRLQGTKQGGEHATTLSHEATSSKSAVGSGKLKLLQLNNDGQNSLTLSSSTIHHQQLSRQKQATRYQPEINGNLLGVGDAQEMQKLTLLTANQTKRPGPHVYSTRAKMFGALRERRAELEKKAHHRRKEKKQNPQAMEGFLWRNGKDALPQRYIKLMKRNHIKPQKLYNHKLGHLNDKPMEYDSKNSLSSESGISEWPSDCSEGSVGELIRRLYEDEVPVRESSSDESEPPRIEAQPQSPPPAQQPQSQPLSPPPIYYPVPQPMPSPIPTPAPAPAPAPPPPAPANTMEEIKEKVVYVKVADKCIQTKLRGRRAPVKPHHPKPAQKTPQPESKPVVPGVGSQTPDRNQRMGALPVKDLGTVSSNLVHVRLPTFQFEDADGRPLLLDAPKRNFLGMVDFEDPNAGSGSDGDVMVSTEAQTKVEIDYLSEDDAGSSVEFEADGLLGDIGYLGRALGKVNKKADDIDRGFDDVNQRLNRFQLQVDENMKKAQKDLEEIYANKPRKYQWLKHYTYGDLNNEDDYFQRSHPSTDETSTENHQEFESMKAVSPAKHRSPKLKVDTASKAELAAEGEINAARDVLGQIEEELQLLKQQGHSQQAHKESDYMEEKEYQLSPNNVHHVNTYNLF